MRNLFKPSRRTAITTAVTLTAATAAVAFVSSASAAPGRPHQANQAHQTNTTTASCSLKTLHGTYLFRGDGVHIEKDGTSEAVAFAGSFHFDGSGKVDRGYISTRVGRAVQSDRPLDGSTYTLAANCTGSFTINNPVHIPVFFDIFASPTGSKFTYIQTDNADEHYDVDATIAERVTVG